MLGLLLSSYRRSEKKSRRERKRIDTKKEMHSLTSSLVGDAGVGGSVRRMIC